MPVKIAIFCSGSGSNAQKIIEYFQEHKSAEVVLLLSNNKNAYALERAKLLGVPTRVFDKAQFSQSPIIVNELKELGVNWIILAGFLWLVPENLIEAFPNSIVNIHPALLPSYGGKGMYGMYVHEAVVKAKEKESGISIHMVNKEYDKGTIVFQAKCFLTDEDTAETLAKKIQALEHEHFPKVIDALICSKTYNPIS
ncbi:phosphoribosylglycinamide formyltransferase [Sporocytophaga myxococcoides]|uniref:Phosphoribosylglycinamide formyltransferase n=1 Tax=Sporocytophaga myxococcoides TaxID=153721 RepID=A0A098LM50_9BACT|nr:phosphoribosylglycinamide formyltransferase [Sporocytophaga myxococcoides]GAL87569.1 phosphoribosylglycinamide formyltransferase [Sporocytophaga myxococcoides]